MDFGKIINEMQELQSKVEVYELQNESVKTALNSIKKDIGKLKKKQDKEQDNINKQFLQIKILIMEDIIKRFETKNS